MFFVLAVAVLFSSIFAAPMELHTNLHLEAVVKNDTVEFHLRLKDGAEDWAAIGFGADKMADGIDICQVYKSLMTGADTVVDRMSSAHALPEADNTTQDCIYVSRTTDENGTLVVFHRKMVTGDAKDKNLMIGANTLVWAYGPVVNSTVQKHTEKGVTSLTLAASGDDDDSSGSQATHTPTPEGDGDGSDGDGSGVASLIPSLFSMLIPALILIM
eukprot:NODE_4666_length_756_cov_73.675676_g4506_i0.p1 GENE.NODE_4666_length_756_cov_73.675676_g4506_i0~~NODE_4666_length_756_cov_73.675676_g4506_i0.p1  ORF type:complete len:233 (+),score=52.21 NODE_4666_length_756_cov_73.675676_g4506_i0:55-699(+)